MAPVGVQRSARRHLSPAGSRAAPRGGPRAAETHPGVPHRDGGLARARLHGVVPQVRCAQGRAPGEHRPLRNMPRTLSGRLRSQWRQASSGFWCAAAQGGLSHCGMGAAGCAESACPRGRCAGPGGRPDGPGPQRPRARGDRRRQRRAAPRRPGHPGRCRQRLCCASRVDVADSDE